MILCLQSEFIYCILYLFRENGFPQPFPSQFVLVLQLTDFGTKMAGILKVTAVLEPNTCFLFFCIFKGSTLGGNDYLKKNYTFFWK